ncbi:cysteine-rich venom protein-like [Sceloporus undulatus]|uniref:cysteine-rich venom protein-like n=1 Tax=Sceloporus undulatus TaxID=8520 RepID=UPI001C4C7036|nr:cysteine-rich venom protein-like [Sceloporus undulatus]
MSLQIMFLLLAVVLQQSPGKADVLLSEISEMLKEEIVNKHNSIRRQVQPTASNMMKMMWNEKAAMSAGRWASKCQAISSPKEERMVDDVLCGELILETNYGTLWSDAIESLSRGKNYFQYRTGATDPTKNIHGYTQIVWHNSDQVGCALAFCPEGTKFIYVCRYCPAGNIKGQLNTPYKAGPPCGDCLGSCEDNLCLLSDSSCPYRDAYDDCDDLVESFTCGQKFVEEQCLASCKCPRDK